MNNNSNTESNHNPPQRQLPNPIAEVAADWEENLQQMRKDGCPPAVLTRMREKFQVALAETLSKSELRAFLLLQIRCFPIFSGFSFSPFYHISSIIDMIFPVSYKKHALRKIGAPYVFFPHTERLFPPFFSGPGYSYTNWFVFSSYS